MYSSPDIQTGCMQVTIKVYVYSLFIENGRTGYTGYVWLVRQSSTWLVIRKEKINYLYNLIAEQHRRKKT